MNALPTHAEIFLYSRPTDMRKSFCGLAGIVRDQLGREPDDGSLFLFINRNKDKLKALYWDRDGLALWYKRLESGTFQRIAPGEDQQAIQIDAAELAMLLGGISVENVKRRKRFKAA